MSDGDSKQLVKDMAQYLVKISQESCHLMKEEFLFLFEAIVSKARRAKTGSHQTTQRVLVPSLMKIATTREKKKKWNLRQRRIMT